MPFLGALGVTLEREGSGFEPSVWTFRVLTLHECPNKQNAAGWDEIGMRSGSGRIRMTVCVQAEEEEENSWGVSAASAYC